MINLPQEIYDKLKHEDNASALITKLLYDYYKYNVEDNDELDNLIESFKRSKEKALKELETEEERIIRLKLEREQKEKLRKEEAINIKNKREQKIIQAINNMNYYYNLPKHIDREELAIEIVDDHVNIFDLMKAKGYDKYYKHDEEDK